MASVSESVSNYTQFDEAKDVFISGCPTREIHCMTCGDSLCWTMY